MAERTASVVAAGRAGVVAAGRVVGLAVGAEGVLANPIWQAAVNKSANKSDRVFENLDKTSLV